MQTVILRKCLLMLLGAALLPSCQGKEKGGVVEKEKPLTGEGDAAAVKKADDSLSAKKEAEKEAGSFEHRSEKFGDSQILRYEVPGFDGLTLEQKKLAYYLYEAALAGRDIAYDQKYKHNLTIRRTLEAMVRTYKGDRKDAEFQQLLTYLKQVWFARGIHHDYSSEKFLPSFSKEFFAKTVKSIDPGSLPLKEGEKVDALIERLTPILFDPKVDAKRVNRDTEADPIRDSANNFYEGLTEKEVDAYYAKRIDPKATRPLSHGLNSKLVKGADGKIEERVWKVDGMYGAAISKVVSWLSKALPHTENAEQKKALEELIRYYKTGDLAAFDAYNIAWVKDTNSRVDVVNGFIEVYGDAKGFRGTYESVVSIKDQEASKRIAAIAGQAQWFEDHSPLIDSHKKKDVVGISAKVITVVVESGDAAPTTPIGINLPNANWIRAEHGSKSVYLGNIVAAYNKSKEGNGLLEEFAFSKEEVERAKKYGTLAQTLFVDMHEVIGHASGQINPGVGTPKETLKSYASALEEGRADLVALYYIMDPKLVEMGLMPNLEVGKAAYDNYIRNGLMVQLARLEAGKQIEESHMRNRQLVAAWAFERGQADKVIERATKSGKTYFVVRDYDKLRTIFGELLREVQRVKSEGDYKSGAALIEDYGVKVDPKIHKEVLKRYQALGVAPYAGFIQPRLVPVLKGEEIVDVKVEYPTSFEAQQLEYSENYSFLPDYN